MNYNIEFIKSAKKQEPIEKIIDEFGTFDEETPVKQVFRPFLSEENVKPKLNLKKINYTQTNQNKKLKYKKSNELLSKIKKDKKEFKSFFKIKNTIFNEIKIDKPEALKKFEKGLKICFFGKDGYITKKVDCLKKIYKKKRNSIGIDTKIYAGTLDFLDLKSKKTSYGGRLDDIKRSYLFRSNNFSVARDRFSRREALFIANNSKKKKNQRILSAQFNHKSPFITDYKERNNFFNETMNILKNNANTINSISSFNESNFINSYRSIPSSAKISKNKKMQEKINKNRLHSPNKSSQEKNENKQNEDNIYSTCEYHNFKSDLYSPIYSPESIKFKKEINKTKKVLNEKIKTMESPIPQLEGELYEIIDRINEFQNEEIIKKDFHKEKLKEDIFIITGIKLPEKKNKISTKNFLKETIEDKDTKYKNAVYRFTKGLKNMDEKTALKCVEEITPYTPKKDYKKLNYNVKKKKVVEEKYFPDEKLRSKCIENDKKMERLTFSLDKLKIRYGL